MFKYSYLSCLNILLFVLQTRSAVRVAVCGRLPRLRSLQQPRAVAQASRVVEYLYKGKSVNNDTTYKTFSNTNKQEGNN